MGEQDFDTQVASEAVRGWGPLSSEEASVRDWLSRRSCAAMKVAVERVGELGGDIGVVVDGGEVCVIVRARSSMEWLRRAWRFVSGARWMGESGEMVYVWCGWVRRRRARVYVGLLAMCLRAGRVVIRTPLTILVPTRVTCPLTISFRGVLTTSVLPGSTGASSA